VDVVYQILSAGAGVLNKNCSSPSQCRALRADFLSYMQNASGLQTLDRSAVNQQATLLKTLTAAPGQLTSDASTTALGLLSSMVTSATSLGVSNETATAAGAVLSNLVEADVVATPAGAASFSSCVDQLSSALCVGGHAHVTAALYRVDGP
jgi:hypothetical protein